MAQYTWLHAEQGRRFICVCVCMRLLARPLHALYGCHPPPISPALHVDGSMMLSRTPTFTKPNAAHLVNQPSPHPIDAFSSSFLPPAKLEQVKSSAAAAAAAADRYLALNSCLRQMICQTRVNSAHVARKNRPAPEKAAMRKM